MKSPLNRFLSLLLVLAGLGAAPALAQADDVLVEVQTRNSTSNHGPFSAGNQAGFHMEFRIDGSIAPTGSTPTWVGGLDHLVLTIADASLGSFVVTGENGKYRQLRGNGGDFMAGGWGGINEGSLSPLSVLNPGLSATPFLLESITFDFRGATLFADALTLPGALRHAPPLTDFEFLDLTLRFSNADPNVSGLDKVAIIRSAAFLAVQVTPVPEPATVSMLLAGMLVIATLARRRA